MYFSIKVTYCSYILTFHLSSSLHPDPLPSCIYSPVISSSGSHVVLHYKASFLHCFPLVPPSESPFLWLFPDSSLCQMYSTLFFIYLFFCFFIKDFAFCYSLHLAPHLKPNMTTDVTEINHRSYCFPHSQLIVD